jgi:hypothetical protein
MVMVRDTQDKIKSFTSLQRNWGKNRPTGPTTPLNFTLNFIEKQLLINKIPICQELKK